jgi:Tol biopolymer transport system component
MAVVLTASVLGLLASASLVAGAVQPLTSGPGNDTEAAWSPDGRKIAFQSDRAGTAGLYVLDLRTSHVTCLEIGRAHV